jgi:hypothetical protein
MQKELPQIDAALIKVTGIFSYKKNQIHAFINNGFSRQIEEDKKFIRDKYYREFASLMFTGEDIERPMIALMRATPIPLTLFLPPRKKGENRREINTVCANQELFLFHNDIGIFSLTFDPATLNFEEISNLTYAIKSFEAPVMHEAIEQPFHSFISHQILNGIFLRDVETDEYSGSKFKVYSIINIEEPKGENHYPIENLVYEIGTSSPIKTIENKGFLTPSTEYYNELTKNSIQVFSNYTGLALLDSFTIVGHKLYSKDNHYQDNTFNRIYFSIYIINIYIKYNVFRFNSVFKHDPIKTRNEFVDFINYYNYSHISFDFLPNYMYQKMHNALGIDEEVKLFEKRLGSLATDIQENQSKRQAFVLGIISVITGIGSSSEIIQLLEQMRNYLHWSSTAFYILLSVIIIFISIPTFFFLYPRSAKKLKEKIMSKMK